MASRPSNGVIVTPNNRLARYLTHAYHSHESQTKKVWVSPQILPWSAWIGTLWDRLSDKVESPLLLSPIAQRYLWQTLIKEENDLLPARHAATAAKKAWQSLHEWREDSDETPYLRWQGGAEVTVESRLFAEWAKKYRLNLTRRQGIDDALLPDFIAAHAASLYPDLSEKPSTLLVGFTHFTPQRLRLITAMTKAGLIVDECEALTPVTHPAVQTYAAENVKDEYRAAFSFAWAHQEKNEEGEVAIIVPDLAGQVDLVRRIAHEMLPDPKRCNITLNMPSMAQSAFARTALDLMELFYKTLPVTKIAVLLQSAFLAGDARAQGKRAAVERHFTGLGITEADFSEVVTALREVDLVLHEHWQNAKTQYGESSPPKRSMDVWLHRFAALLTALTFPGNHAFDSRTHQMAQAWQSCVESLLSLNSVTEELLLDDALSLLRHEIASTVFQPADTGASIHVMGVLEAANIPFHAVWVCGMDTSRYPPYQNPDPLLPIAWQRECRMPGTDTGRKIEDQIAAQHLKSWHAAAPHVVLSYAKHDEEHTYTPASCLQTLPVYELPMLLKDRAGRMPKLPTQTLDDCAAPPVLRDQGDVVETIKQTHELIQHQSDCPFKAFAFSRLRIRPYPEVHDGVSYTLHGSILHQTLYHFWKSVGNQEQLRALIENDTLADAIKKAYRKTVAEPHQKNALSALPKILQETEESRVIKLVTQWCLDIERDRKPFTVRALEFPLSLRLSDLKFSLRADRIDEVFKEVAIIDYKSGAATNMAQWTDERPSDTQLFMYALAWEALNEGESDHLPVNALTYAHLKPDKNNTIKCVGVQTEDHPFNHSLATVDTFKKDNIVSFQDLIALWRKRLLALADEFLSGDARVAARHPSVCKHCGLRALCRLADTFDEEGKGESS
ncbi:MAG: PD-(D/E)XK nuclease family protein [Burkholderiales bacterium]|nr:PD-(D/E)XK nuclease family protein [Burkholderiales bacterium]